MKRLLVISSIALLSGCATPPDKIKPMAFPDTAYIDRSCSELVIERATVEKRLTGSTTVQEKNVNDDAMGVFLVGVPLGTMIKGDRTNEVSMYRGQIIAIDSAAKRKSCG